MKIRVLKDAADDLIKGYNFYETQSSGLGEYFLHTLFSDIDSLSFYAGIHQSYYGFHRLLSKRFPYAIYYTIENKIVCVYAVLDCRQSPVNIQERLSYT